MSYLALARKWRPKIFSEVMGQAHVVKALSNALETGRVHHAFLFTGTRGVGKTTLARIFAKSLNCEQGMSATPCGQCSICQNVDQGSFIDLIEVDAASRTGIDDMRELLDNIQYAPSQGRFKVYLIDEIHMLSKSSFNALLKTLEEPPEHVKFLFATTDPQKLPVTVLSRCLQFNLKALQPDEITEQIETILKAEDISFDGQGVQLISRAADGSLRDALSLLEQAIAQGGGVIATDSVRSMLGTVKSNHMDELIQAIISSDVSSALSTIQSMAAYAADFNAAIDQLLIELHTIALAQSAPKSLEYKVNDVDKYVNYSEQVSAEDIQLCYQIALIAKRDLSLAPDYRSGFEMAILRIIAFKPVDNLPKVVTKDLQSSNGDGPETPLQSENSSSKTSATEQSQSVNQDQTQAQNDSQAKTELVNHKQGLDKKNFQDVRDKLNKAQDSQAQEPETHEPEMPANRQPELSVASQDQKSSSNAVAPELNISDQHQAQAPTMPLEPIQSGRQEPNKPQMQAAKAMLDDDPSMIHAPELPTRNSEKHSASLQSVDNANPPTFSQNLPNDSALTNIGLDVESENDNDIGNKLPVASPSEWAGFIEQLELNGLVRELAMNMACQDINADPMRLTLNPDFVYLKNESRELAIINEIRKLRGSNYVVEIVLEATVEETPAERIKRLQAQFQQDTNQEVKESASVQSFAQAFDMSIDESKIKPK